MSTNYHTAIPASPKQAANAATFNSPLGELDAALTTTNGSVTALAGGATITNPVLREWAIAESWRYNGAPTYHSTHTDVVASCNIVWPDTSAGVYTAVTIDSVWLEPTEYTLTHTASSKTVTFSGLVRNSDGQITTQYSVAVA